MTGYRRMTEYAMPRLIVRIAVAVLLLPQLAPASQTFDTLDEARLLRSLESYKGTPYLYGGTSRSGIYCSGLVLAVYRDQGVTLPRTSRQQSRVGDPIDKSNLQVGDLVFFNTSGRGISHVGIVTGEDAFVHGSTSRGVVEDKLSGAYWRRRFVSARRVATPTTYTVAGDQVGAGAEDKIALLDRYPFAKYELVNIPTIHLAAERSVSLQLRTNIAGDLIVHPQVSLWNRLQLAAYQRFDKMLGEGRPGMTWPDLLVKVRINNQWGHLPGFAVGYDTRQLRYVRETEFVGDTLINTRSRGLFLVGTGTVMYGLGQLVGRTDVHAGGSMHAFRGFDWRDDLSCFVGIDQELLGRVTAMAEIDNIFGEGGWHLDFGARLSITDNTVIEYSAAFVGKNHTKVDKVLKLSFAIPY
jgi:hypothetical protein